MRSNRVLAMAIFIVTTGFAAFADDEKTPAKDLQPSLTVRLIDEEGKPVAGAEVGCKYLLNHRVGQDWKFWRNGMKTDKDGLAEFRDDEDFVLRHGIYARHADRHLVAVHDTVKADTQDVLTLTMSPECHVQYRLSCRQLVGRGLTLSSVILLGRKQIVDDAAEPVESSVHVYLPPGKYRLWTLGEQTHSVETALEIQPGQRELDLGTLDQPATKLALLEGHAAPELHDVIEWKNGPPVKLIDLRGKVVLLDFWGWWCPPCIHRELPALFKLQEEYQGRDLVIIGVHVDADENEVTSVEKLDDKLTQVRKNVWNGKDISFPVALVRAEKTPFGPGIQRRALTELSAEYGVRVYPTTVLIGRDGKVIGNFDAHKSEDQAKLKKLLDDPNGAAQ